MRIKPMMKLYKRNWKPDKQRVTIQERETPAKAA